VVAKKPETLHEPRLVQYDEDRWKVLADLRKRTSDIMDSLESGGVRSFVYGSVARGDVNKRSDVDIIVPDPIPSYRIELALEGVVRRELVQATPSMVLKGHIHLQEETVVTFPLFRLRPREEEFYRWGGMLDLRQLRTNERVPGVDKRLLLIEPVEDGHIESGVIDYEDEVAKKVGVSSDLARERVRVLTRRDSVGRTGVYLTRVLTEDESFEAVTKSLVDSDPALRRTLQRREG
jgi:predicted nucleotidyltransferase